MALIRQFCDFSFTERQELLRYDEYKGTDTEQHKAKLSAEAAAVVDEAARTKLSLTLTTANLEPKPFWCEEIIATVSLDPACTPQEPAIQHCQLTFSNASTADPDWQGAQCR